jgi:hypothetical protein
MNVYAVIATRQTGSRALKAAIESQFADNFLAVTSDVWFVATKASMVDFSKNIGIKAIDSAGIISGTIDDAIVIPIALYWGFADPTIWQWLASKIQEKASG